jgi:Tfp pilus assembly protein PilV
MRGFTLLEVLISSFLLTLMLLGLDAMQWHALRKTKQAHHYFIAAHQVTQMLRISASSRHAYQYEWNNQNKSLLPNGNGLIDAEHIVVTWGEQDGVDCKQTQIGVAGCVSAKILA